MAGLGKAWRKKKPEDAKEKKVVTKKKKVAKEQVEAKREEETKKEVTEEQVETKMEEETKGEEKGKTGLLIVVNLHGQINVPRPVRGALRELQIDRRFSATVVNDDPSTVGLLNRSRDYVAWAPLEEELLAVLLKSRGRVSERRR